MTQVPYIKRVLCRIKILSQVRLLKLISNSVQARLLQVRLNHLVTFIYATTLDQE